MDKQTFMYGIDEICLMIVLKNVMKHGIPHSYHMTLDILRPLVNACAEDRGLNKSIQHHALIKRTMSDEYDARKTPKDNYYNMRSLLINEDNFLNDNGSEKARRIAYLTKSIIDTYSTILVDGTYNKYKLNRKLIECPTRERASKNKK